MNYNEIIQQAVSTDRIIGHIKVLEGVRHPLAAPEALEHAADYIKGALACLDYDVVDHCFSENDRSFRNVIATRRGVRYPHERVVLLAHYDTVAGSPGADDNASGVAVLLEIARVLSRCTLERTIHFVGVSLEENQTDGDPCSGTRGSRALAQYARENRWNIEGVVVLESVAFAGDDVTQSVPAGVAVPVPSVGNFIAAVGNERSQELLQLFEQSSERYGNGLHCVTVAVPGNGEAMPDSRRSDHAPFWDEGYKAIMVTDTTNFRNPHYHQPTDTLKTLNPEFATRVCSATAGAILDMARLTT